MELTNERRREGTPRTFFDASSGVKQRTIQGTRKSIKHGDQEAEKKGCGAIEMSSNRRLSSPLLFFLFLLVPACAAQSPPKFRCGEKAKCEALAGFVPAAETTYEAIRDLFQVASIYDLYGANGLNEATPTSAKVPANATVRVPFPCACANGTGVSDRKPVYTAKSGDSLQKIAGETFAGLVTPQQIAAANGIINASSKLNDGKQLFIPLPCSCDYVDFVYVIHLAHVVKKEMTLGEISVKFSTFPDRLLSFNNISATESLAPGQVLDVPLDACHSLSIHALSPDMDLIVANGSYALTARNCIKCSCNRLSGELSCQRSPDSVDSERCSAMRCFGEDASSSLLRFGERRISDCSVTECVYGGYDERIIWTTTNKLHNNYCVKTWSAAGRNLFRWSLLLFLILLLAL